MSLLKRIILKISGNQNTQNTLTKIVKTCQNLMGIGAGGRVASSGERIPLQIINKNFSAPYYIFDVGSNQGQYLKLILGNMEPEGYYVHCFEPGIVSFNRLSEFGINPRIKLNNLAIGKESGTVSLFYDKAGSTLASLSKRNLDHFGIDFSESETVKIITIEHYCSENHVERIHLLKLDIEGHELDALNGAKNMFEKRLIDLVTFEFGGCNIDSRTYFRDFWLFFKAFDMEIYRITPSGYLYPVKEYLEIYEQFRTTNFLAVQPGISVN